MEDEVPDQALCMEGTDWGMMGYLLRYQPETLLLSADDNQEDNRLLLKMGILKKSVCVCVSVCTW